MSEHPSQNDDLQRTLAQWIAKQEEAGAPALSDTKKRQLIEAGADQEALLRSRIARHRKGGKARQERAGILERALPLLNFARYREIQYVILGARNIADLGRGQLKYLNLDLWLEKKLEVLLQLGLHEQPPLRILDLGTGCGHFPFLCRLFGHQVWASDRHPRPSPGLPVPSYELVAEFLGVKRHDLTVAAQNPLPPFDGPFDRVTALMVEFDHLGRGKFWTPDDWEFFLADLATNVATAHGEVFFLLNREAATVPILALMENRGARVDRSKCQVWFDDLEALRNPPA